MADEWVDVNDWEDVSTQKLQAPPDVASQLKTWGVGAGVVGAGATGIGYGIKKGADWYQKPRETYKGIESQLKTQQAGMGIPDTPYSFGQDVLRGELQSTEMTGQRQLQDLGLKTQQETIDLGQQKLKSQQMLSQQELQHQAKMIDLEDTKLKLGNSTQSLQSHLDAFDGNVIGKDVEQIGLSIKTQAPDFFRSASDSYAKGLADAEMHFERLGGTIDTYDISKLFEKTANEIGMQNVGDTRVASLERGMGKLIPKEIEGQPGLFRASEPITFSQAKGLVSDVIADDPYGPVARKLRYNWGTLIEEKAGTGEIKDKLNGLNSWYKRFKNAQEELISLSDPRTGEFNREGLNKWLLNYSKTRQNDGIVELMNYISKGTENIPGMEGLGEKWQGFNKMLEQRFGMLDEIGKLKQQGMSIQEQISSAQKMSLDTKKLLTEQIDDFTTRLKDTAGVNIKEKEQLTQGIRQRVDKIKGRIADYDKLIARLEMAGEKVPWKWPRAYKVLKGAGKMAMGRLPSVATGVLYAVGLGSIDPTQIMMQISGMDPEQIARGTELWNKIKSGKKLTSEEEIFMAKSGIIS